MINFSLTNNSSAKILACLAIVGIFYTPIRSAQAQFALDPSEVDGALYFSDTIDPSEIDGALYTPEDLASGGIKTAVAQCSGVSPVSSALESLTKSLGIPGGSLVNTAVNSAGKIINTGTGGATPGINSAVGDATKTVKSGVTGAAIGLGDAALGGISSILQGGGVGLVNLGLEGLGQGVVDWGSSLNSFVGEGGGLASLFSGGGGGVMSAFSAITGGGGDIPVNDQIVRDTTGALKKKVTCDDALSYALAYNVDLQMALTKAINFTNTGNNGAPLFVTNQKDYYQNIAAGEANRVIGVLGTTDSPIAKRIIPDVVRANQNETNESFAKKITSTYNPKTCGGYLRCLSQKADQNNNDMGVFGLAQAEIAKRQEEAKTNATNELIAGKGILPVKKCVEWDPATIDSGEELTLANCSRLEVVTPAASNAAQVEQIARSPIEQIMSAGAFGQAPPRNPIDKLIGDLFSPRGFFSLSQRAGFANNPGTISAAKNDITSVNNIAKKNTGDYALLLAEGVDLSGKILVDLTATNNCYTNVDSMLLGNTQNALSSSEKPALGEIGNLANYSTIYNSYQSTLVILNSSSKITTPNNDVYTALAQVEVLRARQPVIASYLENCQTIEKAVSSNQDSSPVRDSSD